MFVYRNISLHYDTGSKEDYHNTDLDIPELNRVSQLVDCIGFWAMNYLIALVMFSPRCTN